nr:TonB-dependent receptor [Aequorivita sp. CIP111184]
MIRLSVGAGAYYSGEHPINDRSSEPVTHQGIKPNQKPFDVEAYSLVNIQAEYKFNRNWSLQFLANNVFNKIGYNAYRTSYINQTDPRNSADVSLRILHRNFFTNYVAHRLVLVF